VVSHFAGDAPLGSHRSVQAFAGLVQDDGPLDGRPGDGGRSGGGGGPGGGEGALSRRRLLVAQAAGCGRVAGARLKHIITL